MTTQDNHTELLDIKETINMKSKELEIALTTYKVAYKKGYTQCKEDMADKKYTEEDMLKAFEKGALYGSTKNGNTHYFDEVINSLNKQD